MFKTSIDSVISDISSKIGKLRDLAEKHASDVASHREEQTKHGALAQFYIDEQDRATRIATKLEELFK